MALGTNFFVLRKNPDGNDEYVALTDASGNVMFAYGATKPTDANAGYAKGCIFMDSDASATAVLYLNEGSATSCDFNVINPAASSATAYDDIGDPDANGSIGMGAYTGTYTSATANWGGIIVSNTHANPTTGATLLTLGFTANGDADGVFLTCKDNSSADAQFTIGQNGTTTIAGVAKGTSALTLTVGDVTLTSGHLVLTSGNATLTSGNMTLTSGNLNMTSGDIDLTAGDVKISADNQKLTLGAADSTDSYLTFNGTDLVFYDSTVGTEKTLAQLVTGLGVDPVVSGNLTITDGKLNWTDAADEVAGTFSFAGTTNNDITWTSSTTSGKCLSITANAQTSGSMVYLETSDAGFSGKYIQCYDGAADDFSVGAKGATTIAGNAAGTDALTVTAGDVFVSDTDGTVFESEDGTATMVTFDNKAGAIADNSAVLLLDAGGAMASGSNILRLAPTGSPNAGAIGIEFVGGTKAMTALSIDADPTASDVVEINGGGALTNGLAVLAVTNDGNLAAGGCDVLITMGGTPNADARAFEIDAQKDAIAIFSDSDAVTDSAYQLTHPSAALAAGKAVLLVSDGGDPADAAGSVIHAQYTGTGTNKSRLIFADGGGKDVTGLYLDSDTATQSASQGQVVLYNNNAGALGGSITVHQDSASPAADDQLLNISVYGEEATSSDTILYAQITAEIAVATDGATEGAIKMAVNDAAATRESFWLTDDTLALGDSAAFTIGSNGSQDLTISTAITTAGVAANEPKIVLTDGASGDVTVTAGGTDGEIVLASPVVMSSTTTAGGTDGAIALTASIAELTSDGDGTALTLANGVEGQVMFLTMVTDGGGDVVVTPASLAGAATTITFSDVGESCTLLFTNSTWCVVGSYGVAVA